MSVTARAKPTTWTKSTPASSAGGCALGWTEELSRHMSTQNYANHAKYVTGYHIVLFGILVLTFVGSLVNLYRSIGDHQRIYSAALIMVLTWCVLVTSFYARAFALKAQDRAIRAEEN